MFGLSEKDEEIMTNKSTQQVSSGMDSMEFDGGPPTSRIPEALESTITPEKPLQNANQAVSRLPGHNESIHDQQNSVTQWLNNSSDRYFSEAKDLTLDSSQSLHNQRSREHETISSMPLTAKSSLPRVSYIQPEIQTPPAPYAESSFSDLEDFNPTSSQTTLKIPITNQRSNSIYTPPLPASSQSPTSPASSNMSHETVRPNLDKSAQFTIVDDTVFIKDKDGGAPPRDVSSKAT